jgi:hypothetical protein
MLKRKGEGVALAELSPTFNPTLKDATKRTVV